MTTKQLLAYIDRHYLPRSQVREAIGEKEVQPVKYFDEVEQDNVRDYPTQEMLIRNSFREKLSTELGLDK